MEKDDLYSAQTKKVETMQEKDEVLRQKGPMLLRTRKGGGNGYQV